MSLLLSNSTLLFLFFAINLGNSFESSLWFIEVKFTKRTFLFGTSSNGAIVTFGIKEKVKTTKVHDFLEVVRLTY